MGNTLFKVIDGDILQKEGSSPSLRYTGYGFNQVAFQVMAHGYKDAADLLAKSQINQGENYNDGLLYPIFFCYRQAVELMLKAIMMNCLLPFNQPRTKEDDELLRKGIHSHYLQNLFEAIIARIKNQGYYDDYQTVLSELKPYIDDFNEFDKGSFSMRYPADKEFEPVDCQNGLKGYDIQYTADHINPMWSLLNDLYSKTVADWSKGRFHT